MRKNRYILPAVLAAVIAGFVCGVVILFHQRFERGDLYPPYSSLRADPLGTCALYESLEEFPGVAAARNYRRLSKLTDGSDTTLLLCGVRPGAISAVPRKVAEGLAAFVSSGGRLVMALFPNLNGPYSGDREAPTTRRAVGPAEKLDELLEGRHSLAERFGFGWDSHRGEGSAAAGRVAKPVSGAPGRGISWHTGLYFTDLTGPWRVTHQVDGRPVVAERKYGNGTVVISADSYYLSNEALLKERHPAMLAWLVGASSKVIFDETHLGVRADPGLAALGRRYGLTGPFVGILVLAGLFVWKSAVRFAPAIEDASPAGRTRAVAGRDAAAGLVSLLQRAIPRKDLLGACMGEWNKAAPRETRDARTRRQRMQQIVAREQGLSGRHRDPVAAYKAIRDILKER